MREDQVSHEDRTAGSAAFHVLTNRHLFTLLPQWIDGWPFRLWTQYREISARIDAADAQLLQQRRFPMPKARRVERFMEELMLAHDIETIQLTSQHTWRDARKNRHRFPVKALDVALRSGHVETVRWAFQHADAEARTRGGDAKAQRYWDAAMDHYPGHDGVLDELCRFVYPAPDLWVYRESTRHSVAVAQWFIRRVGVASVPDRMITFAASHGDLPLVQFLAAIEGQQLALAVKLSANYSSEIRAFLLALPAASDASS